MRVQTMKSGEGDICPNFNLCLSLHSLRKKCSVFETGGQVQRRENSALFLNAVLTRGPQADMGLYHHLLWTLCFY